MASKKKQKKAAAPIQNKALKNAIAALKAGADEEKFKTFLREAMKSKLLVPVIFSSEFKPDASGRVRVDSNTRVSFVMVNTTNGKSFLPAFTDFEEAKKLKVSQEGNLQYVVRSLKEYENMLEDPRNTAEGIVINPMNENMVLPKPLVLAMVKGQDIANIQIRTPHQTAEEQAQPQIQAQPQAPVPGAVPPGMQAIYSEPRIYPTALVNAVYEYCVGKEGLSRVWMRQQLAGGQVAFAFVVETDKPDPELLQGIHDTAAPLAKEVPVVVMSYSEKIEKTVVQGTVPLYDRELEF